MSELERLREVVRKATWHDEYVRVRLEDLRTLLNEQKERTTPTEDRE